LLKVCEKNDVFKYKKKKKYKKLNNKIKEKLTIEKQFLKIDIRHL